LGTFKQCNVVLEIESIGKKISFTTFKAVNSLPLPSLGVISINVVRRLSPLSPSFPLPFSKG
jgi:hypothetical protein